MKKFLLIFVAAAVLCAVNPRSKFDNFITHCTVGFPFSPLSKENLTKFFYLFSGQYCPEKENKQCYVPEYECCSSYDCPEGELCCDEFCGYKCKKHVCRKTNGTEIDDPYCDY